MSGRQVAGHGGRRDNEKGDEMKTSDETKAGRAAHTPGPWRIGDAGATIFGPPNGNPSPVTICAMAGPRGDSRANARLIASAPDLLAALKAIVAALEQPVQYSSLRMAESSDILRADAAAAANIARAAIERAEGRAK